MKLKIITYLFKHLIKLPYRILKITKQVLIELPDRLKLKLFSAIIKYNYLNKTIKLSYWVNLHNGGIGHNYLMRQKSIIIKYSY